MAPTSTTTFLRKNNSNLHACEGAAAHNGPLWRALRKERFRKSDPDKDRQFHALVMADIPDNPFEAVDFRLDMEKFSKTLPADLREIFTLFMQGLTPKQIVERTDWAQPTVYRKIQAILARFKEFYGGDE